MGILLKSMRMGGAYDEQFKEVTRYGISSEPERVAVNTFLIDEAIL